MRVTSRFVLLCLIILFGFLAAGRVDGGLVAFWTFEQSNPTTSGPFSPEQGDGVASGSTHGTFKNDQAVQGNFIGNGSTWSFGSHGWQEADYFQFEVATTGKKDIRLNWDQTRSFNGPADFALQYSTDGQTFGDFALYSVLLNDDIAGRSFWDSIVPRQAVYTFDFDLAGVDAINNAPTVFFRLRGSEAGAVENGSGRVDNFLVTAEPTGVPLPAGVWSGLIVLCLLAARGGASLCPGVKGMLLV